MSGRGRGAGGGGDSARRRVVLDPTELFKALAAAKIDYILIGGLAVSAHGSIRATEDMDICPDPKSENLHRLADFLVDVEAVSLDEDEFEAGELPAHDFEGLKGGGNFRLRTKLGALDIMQHVEPFGEKTWLALDKNAVSRQPYGPSITIRVCSYEDLVEMKRAAGRDQDRVDLNNLKAARREL